MKRTEPIKTSEHTQITHEVEFTNNAPHYFIVQNNEGEAVHMVEFQNGPIQEVGVNGLTNEDLLHMVRLRLEGFQNSPYACDENAKALHYVNETIAALAERTKGRIDRGVEGTHVV